ncbi:MAG: Glucokinase [Lentisphaerae bacterium ADurb.BinA184]|nr:MAG: Glucokinase [Lentisphaerae bacterium ADurb.BinA184]
MTAYIGIDKGGTRHTLALADGAGTVMDRRQYAAARAAGAQAEIAQLRAALTELFAVAAARGLEVAGIGVSFGGPVDPASGEVLMSHHVAGWEHLPLARVLAEGFGVPAWLENDANVGALGEWRFGAGRGCQDLFYINVGTGIGGGVIANGRLVHGVMNLAGEIGHMTVQPGGPLCTCGRHGCLESLASGSAIERQYRERSGTARSGREILALAAAGDPVARETVSATADWLALGIGAAVSLFSPELVVVGGGLGEAGPVLFEPLRRRLPDYVIPQRREVRVVPAALGYDAGVRGAIALAMDHTAAP